MANSKNITFDQLQAALSRVKSALDGKANTSHGNHVPKTETANNARFLRNDNTWQTITPVNIGAADRSHSHGSYVNQNAFTNIKVGDTTVAADSPTDTLTLTAGANVTLTPDATNDTVTIAAKDTVYTHPTTSGYKHIPSGGSSGQILRWSADGTAAWGSDNNTDTKVTNTLNTTAKAYVTGTTSATTNTGTQVFDTGVYLDTTAGKLVATTFAGALSGNASSATKLQTARTLTIGNKGKTFDGSANVSWSLSEIGAAASGHTHNKITSRGKVAAETGTTRPAVDGLSMTEVYNNEYPTAYGNVITLKGQGDGQILVGWSGSSGGHAPVYVRSKRDTADANWSGWAQFYTSANPQPSVTGNAGTATKLATARTLTIGNTGKTFNGTADVAWTLAEIGAAAASHGTHVTWSTTTPKANGTAAVGTETKVARGDHVHPLQTTVSGNAGTATKLQTARTLTIGNTGKNFDGSGNVTWTLSEIGAASSGHSHTNINFLDKRSENTTPANVSNGVSLHLKSAGTAGLNDGGDYYASLFLKPWNDISGGPYANIAVTGNHNIWLRTATANDSWNSWKQIAFTSSSITGNAATATKLQNARNIKIGNTTRSFNGTADVTWTLADIGAAASSHTHSYIPLSGSASITGNLEFSNSGTSARGIIGTAGDNDYWRIVGGATASNAAYLEIATADDANEPIYVRQYGSGKFGTLTRTATLLDGSGNTSFPGTVTAPTFKGSLNGNASSATKLQTARKINDISFDGTADKTIPLKTFGSYVGDNNTKNYHRILSSGNVTGQYTDKSITLMASGDFDGGAYGIVRIILRTNSSTSGSTGKIEWIARKGFGLDSIVFNIKSTAGATIMDVFYKSPGTYACVTWTVLGEGGRDGRYGGSGGYGATWTKYNTHAVEVESYTADTMKTIASYTSTMNQGTDVAHVNTSAKLNTARSINGTNFDGSRNITTANWGTARTLTVGNTGKSVNGSGNVSWSLAEIGALPLAGGTMTGAIKLNSAVTSTDASAPTQLSYGLLGSYGNLKLLANTDNNAGANDEYVHIATARGLSPATDQGIVVYGTYANAFGSKIVTEASGNAPTATKLKTARSIGITGAVSGSANFDGSGNISIITTYCYPTPGNFWNDGAMVVNANTGVAEAGIAIDFHLTSNTNDDYHTRLLCAGNNKNIVNLPTGNGTLALTTDNVASATKLQTARNIKIGNTSRSFNGTGDVTWTLSDIGAAASNHGHSYLPLSGGTMTGNITFGEVTNTSYPANSSKITWNGSTDGADIYYRVTASDKGQLVLNLRDDADATIGIALNGTVKTTFDTNGYYSGKANQANTLATARTLTIGNTGKTFNGSGNVSWSLGEIGAAPSGHTHNQILDGNSNITIAQANDRSGLDGKNNIDIASWYGVSISNGCSNGNNYGQVTFSVDARNGNVWARGTVKAPTFSGSLSGNASSATKLQTARTIKIGNTSRNFDGTGNVTWTLSDIGAAASNHSHSNYAASNHSHSNYAASSHEHNYLNVKGTNTINSTANDTTAKWGAHKNSVHWYTETGKLNGQPSQWGYLVNIGQDSEVHQVWMTQSSGDLLHRGGNASGWAGSWKTILDSSNYSNYAAAKSHTHNYAASNHTHNYAAANHTHNYAASNHNHDSAYLKLSGGTLSGSLTVNNNVYSKGFCVSKNNKEVWLDIGDNDTYIWASGANKSLQITHSGDLNFDGKPVLYGGRGNNYDTATNTIYFNNAGASHKGRISCYKDGSNKDYVQTALRTASDTTNYVNIYEDSVKVGSNNICLNGKKLTIATSAPSGPATGDVWINIG